MEITAILSLGIVGAFTSLVVSYIKAKFGTEGYKTKAITIGLSVLVGSVFAYLSNIGQIDAVYNILSLATIIYAFIIKE